MGEMLAITILLGLAWFIHELTNAPEMIDPVEEARKRRILESLKNDMEN